MATTALPLTATGLVVVKMSQSASYHLARPEQVATNWGGTVALCGIKFGSPVDAISPTEVANVPLYRGKNEFNRCERCTVAATA